MITRTYTVLYAGVCMLILAFGLILALKAAGNFDMATRDLTTLDAFTVGPDATSSLTPPGSVAEYNGQPPSYMPSSDGDH